VRFSQKTLAPSGTRAFGRPFWQPDWAAFGHHAFLRLAPAQLAKITIDKWNYHLKNPAMKTHLDKAGRLVIPKSIRDKMGIEDHDELRIDTADGRIWIEPVHQTHVLEERQGVLKVTSAWVGEPAIEKIIRTEREKRLKRLMGA